MTDDAPDHRLIRARAIMPHPFAMEGTPDDLPHFKSLRRSAWEAVDREDKALAEAGFLILRREATSGP